MGKFVAPQGIVKRFAHLFAASICALLLPEAVACSGDSFSAADGEHGDAGEGTSGSASSVAGSASGAASAAGGAAGSGASGGTSTMAQAGAATGGNGAAGGGANIAGHGPASGGSTGGVAGEPGELPAGGFTGGNAAAMAGAGSGGFATAGAAGSPSAGVGGVGAAGGGGVSGGGAGGVGGSAGAATAGAAGTATAGLGGMGGAPVTLPFIENFEDGNVDGWNLYSLNAYTYSVLPGTGANNTARSLQLTKTQDTGFCCDGYYRQFPAGLLPKSVSLWMRADVAGTDGGYFRLSGTTDATQWLANVYFYQTGLVMQAEQSLSVVYTAGRWYHVEFRNIDWVAHRFEYWVDDVQLGTVNMKNPAAALKRIDLYGRAASNATPATAYLDELELKP